MQMIFVTILSTKFLFLFWMTNTHVYINKKGKSPKRVQTDPNNEYKTYSSQMITK